MAKVIRVKLYSNSAKCCQIDACLLILKIDNNSKDTAKVTQAFLKAKKWDAVHWPSQSQSPDLNPTENVFHLLKTKLKTERPTNKQNRGQLQLRPGKVS